jgi:hypothetical protein
VLAAATTDNDTAAIGVVTIAAAAVASVCFVVIVVAALILYAKRRKTQRPPAPAQESFVNPQFRPLPSTLSDRIYEHINDNSYEIPVPQYEFASESPVADVASLPTYAVPVRPAYAGARVEPGDGYLGVTPDEEAMYDLATMVHDDDQPVYDLGTATDADDTYDLASADNGYIDVGVDQVADE